MQRDGVAEGRGWSWYYDAVAKYATCVNARVWVEVGAAWGSLARHMLLHAPTIQEYHIVDPFLGGYDKADPMSKQFAMAVANRSLDAISHAWARHIGWALGTSPEANAGCRLRIHWRNFWSACGEPARYAWMKSTQATGANESTDAAPPPKKRGGRRERRGRARRG